MKATLPWLAAFLCAVAACTIAPVSNTLRISCAASAVMSILLIVSNLAAGETCRCSIRTAVQTADLPSLRRIKQAKKVLDPIRARITAAQGQLTPEEMPSRFQQWPAAGWLPRPYHNALVPTGARPRLLRRRTGRTRRAHGRKATPPGVPI